MFGIDSGELLIIAVVALVVIGPKDLPRVMRTVGHFVGRARGMAKHFRSGFDTMMREAELEEMEKKWRSDNERIMREHPLGSSSEASPGEVAGESDWGKPGPPVDDGSRPKPIAPPRPASAPAASHSTPAPEPPSEKAP